MVRGAVLALTIERAVARLAEVDEMGMLGRPARERIGLAVVPTVAALDELESRPRVEIAPLPQRRETSFA